jgi:predicted ArsR family transcriptional regulator
MGANMVHSDIPESVEIHDPDAVNLLFHEVKSKIIDLLIQKPWTLRQISKELDLNPGTVKRHLVDLIEKGLIQQISEEQNEFGVNQIFYRAIASNYIFHLDYRLQIKSYLESVSNKDNEKKEKTIKK